jgi:ribose-phosphate pyrophosphokinase
MNSAAVASPSTLVAAGRCHFPAEPAPLLFATGGDARLAAIAASELGLEVRAHEERRFEDGEYKVRPLESVRNRSVHVFAELHSVQGESVNDRLVKLFIFLDSLRQSGARSITLVAPYLCYARKDRQTKPRDPLTLRMLAKMIEAAGCDRLVTVTVHNLSAFQNAFRIPTEHLDLDALLARALAPALQEMRTSVVSPDIGGDKRAELFREKLEEIFRAPVEKALIEKHRSMGIVSGDLFAGSVAECTAIILDDMISTGGTMLRAATACRAHGALRVVALATHGLFCAGSEAFVAAPEIDEIWVTDSVPLPAWCGPFLASGHLRVTGIGRLLGTVIAACESGGSINMLLEHDARPFREAHGE